MNKKYNLQDYMLFVTLINNTRLSFKVCRSDKVSNNYGSAAFLVIVYWMIKIIIIAIIPNILLLK
jgi:hypothetical protein